jgi:hypothetical protein
LITAFEDSVIAKTGRIDMPVNNVLLPFIARFPRTFINALLSKKFELDRLWVGRRMTGSG